MRVCQHSWCFQLHVRTTNVGKHLATELHIQMCLGKKNRGTEDGANEEDKREKIVADLRPAESPMKSVLLVF